VNLPDADVEEGGGCSASPGQVLESPVAAREESDVHSDRNMDYGTRVIEPSSSTEPPSSTPSAPPLSEAAEDSNRLKSELYKRIFALLSAQLTLFTVLTALFVYVPHLRKIFRVDIFDKLFLASGWIGGPLIVVPIFALFFFPVLRRKFAKITLTILTACMSFLLSYVMSKNDSNAFMMSMAASDACSLSAIGLSFMHFDLTSKTGLLYYPIFMTLTSAIYPSLMPHTVTYTQSILPSVLTTVLMTHFGLNARTLLRDPTIELKRSEYPFGVAQLYMQFSEASAMKSLYHKIRHSRGYQSI